MKTTTTTQYMVALSVAGALLCAACHSSAPVDQSKRGERSLGGFESFRNVQSWSVFGPARVTNTEIGVACAGRVELKQGSATVKDACFSGDTNVVVCTDVTAANPVMCAPGKDTLSVAGTGTDTISYARVK